MYLDAVIRQLEIIGEATTRIPDQDLERVVGPDWTAIKGFRTIAAHEYWQIEPAAIDEIVADHLDGLVRAIDEAVEAMDQERSGGSAGS